MSVSLRAAVVAREAAPRASTRGLVEVADRALADTAGASAIGRSASAVARGELGVARGDAFARVGARGEVRRDLPTSSISAVTVEGALIAEELAAAGIGTRRPWGWLGGFSSVRLGWGRLLHHGWRAWAGLGDLLLPLRRLGASVLGWRNRAVLERGTASADVAALPPARARDLDLGEDVRGAQQSIRRQMERIAELSGRAVADHDPQYAETVRESIASASRTQNPAEQAVHFARGYVAALSITQPKRSSGAASLVAAALRGRDISDTMFRDAVRAAQREQLAHGGHALVDAILRAPADRFQDLF